MLNSFDVLVVPSVCESFGLTIAEGLWMGVPVVSTASGIAKLAPGITRIIPVAADGPTIAAEVSAALGTDPVRDQARAAILPRLSLERFGRDWTDLLISLVAQPAFPGTIDDGQRLRRDIGRPSGEDGR